MSQRHKAIVFTLPGYPEPGLAIAAARAGALGILDLTGRTAPAADSALKALSRLAGGNCGVALSTPLSRGIIAALPDAVGHVVLSGADTDLAPAIAALKDSGRQVLVEVLSAGSARAAHDAGADGLILKGNEAGGRVGDETAFVLLQRCLDAVTCPMWVRGGIGPHTAAACIAAGAAGVVLDWQLALARESPLSREIQKHLASPAGTDSFIAGDPKRGEMIRVHARPRTEALARVREAETVLRRSRGTAKARKAWRDDLINQCGGGSAEALLVLGQDVAFAARLAEKFVTVAGILDAVTDGIPTSIEAARDARPLDEDSPLAVAHGTRYPIVQGPMTRVSDVAGFCNAVAESGALPFLALALMRGPQSEEVLASTKKLVGDKPWGVGILGFVPAELREEQLAAIRRHRPPFAIIAGGRPDQAAALEADGITTYLHVPSPDLLDSFLRAGSRRFIFEGNECGGHIGPRSSFVLWEEMIAVLVDHIDSRRVSGSECHVVFAGGIHDARSAAMVAVLAAALTERGVKIGVSMGTAYLFTHEAVATGAIVEGFQQQALECDYTAVLELSPGHVIRCTDSPFVEMFVRERDALLDTGVDRAVVADALEEMVVGRLRLASKGIKRVDDTDGPRYIDVPPDEQQAEGFFMIGQVAALRDELIDMSELHRTVTVGGTVLLQDFDGAEPEEAVAPPPCDVAIIGMGAILPGAPNFREYWRNILDRVDAIKEVPPRRFNLEQYFDPDRLSTKDRTYSRWGGFLDPIPLDPLRYGMPPNSLASIDPVQLLALEAARLALDDAGYAERPFDRERTAVFVGAGGYGGGDLGTWYGFRTSLPGVFGDRADEVIERLGSDLPVWTEDSFAGVLPNVIAGRIANRFNLGGTNLSVDAACASSLASVSLACRELQSGVANVAIAGGADTTQNPLAYICFSQTQALSPTGHCRAFDEDADGTTTSEGAGMVVLKRLADAERDGDRIYAVIKGVGGASDGRDKGLTAPRAEGQIRALQRAYAQARVSPATIELVEAHGTGTVVGDRTEVEAMTRFWSQHGAPLQNCALGSVKSMIGHTKCAAGVAGLIKGALAVHEKVLPPTLHVERPNSEANFPETPFYVNTEARPWIHADDRGPRRAGVSAFGFGGTNFHVVLEEYRDGIAGTDRSVLDGPDSELLTWRFDDRVAFLKRLADFDGWLGQTDLSLASIARAVCEAERKAAGSCRLAIVAGSVGDLRQKVAAVRSALGDSSTTRIDDRQGILYAEGPREPVVAFLFSGQGSQYPNMGRDLMLHQPAVRGVLERAETVLEERFEQRLGRYVFPPPTFDPDEERRQREALVDTHVAQPALGALEAGMATLLHQIGVYPAMVAGHSYGEFVALWEAGVLSDDDLFLVSEARGRSMAEADSARRGAMAAVAADAETVGGIVSAIDGVVVANLNSPRQTVISGDVDAIEVASAALAGAGLKARRIDVACAFHSPAMENARAALAQTLEETRFAAPTIPVYSNTTAGSYPGDESTIRTQLIQHMVEPVQFAPEIEAMYEAGVTIFVEVGPNAVLTNLTGQILGDRPHVATAIDAEGQDGMRRFQLAAARLFVEGVPVNAAALFGHRSVRAADLTAGPVPLSPSTWMVDGGRALPLAKVGTVRARQPIELPVHEVAAAPAYVPQPAPGTATVITQFQDVMSRFLETQESVMRAYLDAPVAANGHGREVVSTNGHAPVPAMPVPGATAPAEPEPTIVPESVEPPPEPEITLTREVLIERLLAAVAERTGYPTEMLALDADLEADLGIDSIKRVEILVGFQDQLSATGTLENDAIDELTRIRTLGGIIDWAMTQGESPTPGESRSQLDEQLVPVEIGGAQASGPPANGQTNGHAASADVKPIHRAALRVIDAHAPAERASVAPGVVLITDDGRGTAAALGARLRENGTPTALVTIDDAAAATGPGLYTCPFDEDGVRKLVEVIHENQGTVSAIVHLLPLRPFGDQDSVIEVRKRLAQDVEGLFLLTRDLGADLRAAAMAGGAAVIGVTGMGGAYGLDDTDDWFPGNGAIPGYCKTLGLEWPDVRVRAVDIAPSAPSDDLASLLRDELFIVDSCREVGHWNGRRIAIRVGDVPVDGRETEIVIDSSNVILLTGGARGVTAHLARGLARRYQPTLILAGTAPEPSDEQEDIAALTSMREIKAHIVDRLRREGETPKPKAVEAAYQDIMKAREIRATLRDIRAAGSEAWYVQIDLRHEEAVSSLLDSIYERFGRLDGVVHGAGIIADKLVESKDLESFHRVYSTKVDGALNLVRHLRLDDLRFLLFFSSLVGRDGNRGQADYSAANETLNKLARRLDRQIAARVAAIQWGPWLGTGMMAPEVQRLMVDQGITLIDLTRGDVMFDEEVRTGRKGEPEILIGGTAEYDSTPDERNGFHSNEEAAPLA